MSGDIELCEIGAAAGGVADDDNLDVEDQEPRTLSQLWAVVASDYLGGNSPSYVELVMGVACILLFTLSLTKLILLRVNELGDNVNRVVIVWLVVIMITGNLFGTQSTLVLTAIGGLITCAVHDRLRVLRARRASHEPAVRWFAAF